MFGNPIATLPVRVIITHSAISAEKCGINRPFRIDQGKIYTNTVKQRTSNGARKMEEEVNTAKAE